MVSHTPVCYRMREGAVVADAKSRRALPVSAYRAFESPYYIKIATRQEKI